MFRLLPWTLTFVLATSGSAQGKVRESQAGTLSIEEIYAHLNGMADTSSLPGELSRQMGEYSRILTSQGPETLAEPGKIADALRKKLTKGESLAGELRHDRCQLLEIRRN